MVQWPGLFTFTAEGKGSIPGSLVSELRSHKLYHTSQPKKERGKKKKKETNEVLTPASIQINHGNIKLRERSQLQKTARYMISFTQNGQNRQIHEHTK